MTELIESLDNAISISASCKLFAPIIQTQTFSSCAHLAGICIYLSLCGMPIACFNTRHRMTLLVYTEPVSVDEPLSVVVRFSHGGGWEVIFVEVCEFAFEFA